MWTCSNKKGVCISWIQSDHGKEFENECFQSFCEKNGILHNFLTSQHNSCWEKKKRPWQEMVRTTLNDNSILRPF